MNIPNNWLSTKAHLLVDMQDLLLVQRCIQLQQESDWFALPGELMREIAPAQPKHILRRKRRLVNSGVLTRKLKVYGHQSREYVYQLVINDD